MTDVLLPLPPEDENRRLRLQQSIDQPDDTETWFDKIHKAKEAREAGRRLRKGKPKVFRGDGSRW